jgi:glycosyltransferase involved in cell wall biosynthesis
MPKISIIVPIYNTEEYLAKSISSLRNQTLSDIQIILVNDGSTDESYTVFSHDNCPGFAQGV